MPPSEIAILGFGLGFGGAVGITVSAVLRGRFGTRREVRITVAPNAVTPRRASTLAYAEMANDGGAGPSTLGDEAWPYLEETAAEAAEAEAATAPRTPPETPPIRTHVLAGPMRLPANAVAVPIGDCPPPVALPAGTPVGIPVGVRVAIAPEAPMAVAAAREPAVARSAPASLSSVPPLPAPPPAPVMTVAWSRAPVAPPAPRASFGPVVPPPSSAPAPIGVDACAAERRLVDERCAAAIAVRDRARDAAARHHELRVAFERLTDRAADAAAGADPDGITSAKDALHREFRAAREAAATPAAMEAAAKAWLDGVNHVNASARDARIEAEHADRELRELQPRLELAAFEAEAARAVADTADAACREAREQLAACEERQLQLDASAALGFSSRTAVRPAPFAGDDAGEQPVDIYEMLVVRLLRDDRVARDLLAARLSGGDEAEHAAWLRRLDAFAGAVTSRAIDDGYLELPDDGFWRPFTRSERREIVVALAALGYRFDGDRGYEDARVPLQRDLALAIGYAGLDRMRIRSWPADAELAHLYADAQVAADEWLADHATDLSLGRMVDALGGRADVLADLWNAWGRVRPALIAIA